MPDFLIIGAGAVGLSTAQALLQSGYKVTLTERGTVGQEASWAGGGIMSPLCSWDYGEAVTRLTQCSMGMFEAAMSNLHQATGINPEYIKSGMLLLPPYDDDRALAWCASHQVASQELTLSEVVPGMIGSGLLLPEIAQVRNPRLLQALRRHVELLGGVILENQEALSLQIENERVVALQTSLGSLCADNYVVTAGAWSKTLLGEYAMGMDVHPVRGQILLFKFATPPFPHILLQENLYFIPRRDGHVLVGSTLEEAGFDKSTTDEAKVMLLHRISALFPNWPAPVQHWAGLRPASPGNIPTIGRHPNLANLYANCGHFRYGVTMSVACASLLLAEIQGHTPPLASDEYRWSL